MLELRVEKSFKKDLQRDRNSGQFSVKDFKVLQGIMTDLQHQKTIIPKYKRHPLKYDLKGLESIHIKFNWLLIFRINYPYLELIMLGSHSQVYKKF